MEVYDYAAHGASGSLFDLSGSQSIKIVGRGGSTDSDGVVAIQAQGEGSR